MVSNFVKVLKRFKPSSQRNNKYIKMAHIAHIFFRHILIGLYSIKKENLI